MPVSGVMARSRPRRRGPAGRPGSRNAMSQPSPSYSTGAYFAARPPGGRGGRRARRSDRPEAGIFRTAASVLSGARVTGCSARSWSWRSSGPTKSRGTGPDPGKRDDHERQHRPIRHEPQLASRGSVPRSASPRIARVRRRPPVHHQRRAARLRNAVGPRDPVPRADDAGPQRADRPEAVGVAGLSLNRRFPQVRP